MNTSKLAIAGLVVLGIVLIGSSFRAININVQMPKQNPDLTVGAASGPDRFNPCESTDGILSCFAKQSAMTQASTTVCSIKSPNATSTARLITVKETISSTTASQLDIGISMNPTATTTVLGSAKISANDSVNLVIASSTILRPNMYVVVNQTAAAGLIANPTGQCQATFTTF